MISEKKIIFFEPCSEPWREGYLIPVRNRLNNMLQREFLPVEYKSQFLEQWGEKIIFDDKFINWYYDLRKKEE
jgi:hypothetical protein